MKRRVCAYAFAVAALTLILPAETSSDTLFKGNNAIRIGRGTQEANRINWSDCDGSNKTSFEAPPYSVDRADNCSVGPRTFGLRCEGERCTLVAEERLKRYLPAARNGDTVVLQMRPKSVELRHEGVVVHLDM